MKFHTFQLQVYEIESIHMCNVLCTCSMSLAESTNDSVFVAMGTDRGEVVVWKVGIHQMYVT